MYYYKVYGITVQTPFPIIELVEIMPQKVDIIIEEKPLPDSLEETTAKGSFFQNTFLYEINKDKILIKIDKAGKYFISSDNKIYIDRLKGVSNESISLYLLGPCFAYWIMLKGYFALHGSALKIAGKCILFLGDSGVGKSTTAAKLISKGYNLLSDDLCMVKFDVENTPIIYPAFPQLRLWENSIEKLEYDKANLNFVSETWNKYRVPVKDIYYDKPLPLFQIFELCPTNINTVQIKSLLGFSKLEVLLRHTFRNFAIPSLNLEESHFKFCSDLVQKVKIKRIERPIHQFLLDELIEAIELDLIQ